MYFPIDGCFSGRIHFYGATGKLSMLLSGCLYLNIQDREVLIDVLDFHWLCRGGCQQFLLWQISLLVSLVRHSMLKFMSSEFRDPQRSLNTRVRGLFASCPCPLFFEEVMSASVSAIRKFFMSVSASMSAVTQFVMSVSADIGWQACPRTQVSLSTDLWGPQMISLSEIHSPYDSRIEINDSEGCRQKVLMSRYFFRSVCDSLHYLFVFGTQCILGSFEPTTKLFWHLF